MKDIARPPSDFDEANYLRLNPDVALAVKNGAISSGWLHAIAQGYREGRVGISADVVRQIEYCWGKISERVPPSKLRARVHGSANIPGFWLAGTRVASDLELTFNQMDIAFPPGANVLDFGCGCGRVMTHLASEHPGWKLFGSDIDEEAIRWCQNHLSDLAEFSRNNERPPSRFPDNFFDFVYSISIFTHLPEDMQFAWLGELGRVTRPGGVLFLTTHGMDLLPAERKNVCNESGFYYSIGRGTDGLPAFYQTTYHSHDYIRERWSKYFDIIEILTRGINSHQDLVVCRRRQSANHS